ncbi:MAG: ComEC/Rec2 family competence protein, partial [FCB group bacterium]|nr:ComEC/Rec2 family competence protein [FCB group bacterium]
MSNPAPAIKGNKLTRLRLVHRNTIQFLGGIPVLKLLPFQIIGILIGHWFQIELNTWAVFAVAAILALLSSRKGFLTGITMILIMGFVYELNDPKNEIHFDIDQDYQFTCVVNTVRNSQYSTKLQCTLFAGDLKEKVLLKLPAGTDALPGDTLVVKSAFIQPSPARNPGAFDYGNYLAKKGIYYISDKKAELLKIQSGAGSLHRMMFLTRQRIGSLLDNTIDAPFSGVMKGLLLGEKSAVDDDIRSNFVEVGVVHILAVSGLHVGFIYLILSIIGKLIRLNDLLKLIFVSAGLLFYMALTGFPASVVRAGTMAILYSIGRFRERDTNPWNILGVTALMILFLDPQQLFSAGFILSFSAVCGILFIFPKLQKLDDIYESLQRIRTRRLPRQILDLLYLTIAAQIGTFIPISLMYHSFPLYGLIANLFIVSLVGLAVIAGLLTLAGALISPVLGSLDGQTAWGLLW